MRVLVFGLGYSASVIADALRARDARVEGTTRDGREGSIAFDDDARVAFEIENATHILSSVPPDGAGDPVLHRYGAAIAARDCWAGYLSSTGVYGDAKGAWVDETSPIGGGRRAERAAADAQWLAAGAHVFRLPGIYGPGRSPLDAVRAGRAHRVEVPGQVFSRIHVEDLAAGVLAAIDGPPGAYNLADDHPAPQADVVAHACALLGVTPPPLVGIEDASLSAAARGFYSENRRVANGKAKRVLGWRLRYPDYRSGLAAIRAKELA